MKESTKRQVITLLKEANSEMELRSMFNMVATIALYEKWDDTFYREIFDKYFDLVERLRK